METTVLYGSGLWVFKEVGNGLWDDIGTTVRIHSHSPCYETSGSGPRFVEIHIWGIEVEPNEFGEKKSTDLHHMHTQLHIRQAENGCTMPE